MSGRLFTFVGGQTGPWRVERTETIIGESWPSAPRIEIMAAGIIAKPDGASWTLRGITSNERYVKRSEREQLVAKQPPLNRAEATCAALIPIRKSAAWWALTQDERRGIIEERSRHIETGLKYLPAVGRRLHHCRDLSENEPFDFLTWFEFAPADAGAFDALVRELRETEEWKFVDREVEIRLTAER